MHKRFISNISSMVLDRLIRQVITLLNSLFSNNAFALMGDSSIRGGASSDCSSVSGIPSPYSNPSCWTVYFIRSPYFRGGSVRSVRSPPVEIRIMCSHIGRRRIHGEQTIQSEHTAHSIHGIPDAQNLRSGDLPLLSVCKSSLILTMRILGEELFTRKNTTHTTYVLFNCRMSALHSFL